MKLVEYLSGLLAEPVLDEELMLCRTEMELRGDLKFPNAPPEDIFPTNLSPYPTTKQSKIMYSHAVVGILPPSDLLDCIAFDLNPYHPEV